MTGRHEKQLAPERRPPEPSAASEPLACCPLCGGEIQATIERYYSLRGGVWVESGVDGDGRLYCENDCDLSEYSGRIPEVGSATVAPVRLAREPPALKGCHPA